MYIRAPSIDKDYDISIDLAYCNVLL